MIVALPTYDHSPDDSAATPCQRCAETREVHVVSERISWRTDKLVSELDADWTAEITWNNHAGFHEWELRGSIGYYARGSSPSFDAAKVHVLTAYTRLKSLPKTFLVEAKK